MDKIKISIVDVLAGAKAIAMQMKETRATNHTALIRGGVLDPHNHPSKE
jgi:hypothetical protein